jgi:hypothetical protein
LSGEDSLEWGQALLNGRDADVKLVGWRAGVNGVLEYWSTGVLEFFRSLIKMLAKLGLLY